MSQQRIVSKSRFKAKALEYFRWVEETGQPLIITDRGRPVLRVTPYRDDLTRSLALLRGSVIRYEDPTEPVAPREWEALK